MPWLFGAFTDDHFFELTGLVQFDGQVAAADELAVDIKLGKRWPVRKCLDAVTQFTVRVSVEDIGTAVFDVEALENLKNS